MLIKTTYLRPNITVELEIIKSKKFYVYNYQGVHYRVFNSLKNLQSFIKRGSDVWVFDCDTENQLEKYFLRIVEFLK